MVEHIVSLIMSDKLIALTKELCKDEAALKRLKILWTTDLSWTFKKVLVSTLQNVPFSLNMDESTSSNFHHVCTILVAYFSEVCNNTVVEHLGSLDAPSCTIENFFSTHRDLFVTHYLPWSNLFSVLSGSASTMRGTVSSVEVKIRSEVAPNLLDISDESCHHMHNVVKKFTTFFEYLLESLFRDVSNEFQYSTDSILSIIEGNIFPLGVAFLQTINVLSMPMVISSWYIHSIWVYDWCLQAVFFMNQRAFIEK